jgi:hypothetical protein
LEARDTAIAEHQVNVVACKDGRQSCDYSKLTQEETSALAIAEHQRNYTSCLKGYGYCDRSRLTPAEAAAIPTKNSPAPR